ncbi:MAG: DUF1275 family protein, partial [Enterovibrio sp.]
MGLQAAKINTAPRFDESAFLLYQIGFIVKYSVVSYQDKAVISKLPRAAWCGGFILAACAGLTNAIAVLGFAHNAISYLTGMVAKSSIALAQENMQALIPTISIIGAFFVGAMLSGFVVKN